MLGGSRNAWLDSLRAIAIASVLLCHIASSFRQLRPYEEGGWLAVAGVGGHGVDLFFVLSGWLLGCLLLKEKCETSSIDIKRFWSRRWLRTLPAYYTLLILTLGQRILQGTWDIQDALYFLFIQNYTFESLPFFGISWSLCIEEQFYLLIAPLLLILPTKTWITAILSLLIVFPITGRWLLDEPSSWLTHLRIDGCALGVLLAHIFLNYPDSWKRLTRLAPWGIWLGLVAISFIMLQRFQGKDGSLPLSAYTLLSGCLVIQSQASVFWKTKATHLILKYIASRSYSLYLVHIEALAIARRIDNEHFLLYSLISITVSFILAECLYRFVEQPWMRFRDRSPSENLLTTNRIEEGHKQLA